MYARVTAVSGSPQDVELGIANFRANVAPFACEQGRGAIFLVDRETGKGMSITLWEDEAALHASAERANALRAQAVSEMGATQQPVVEHYEVAFLET